MNYTGCPCGCMTKLPWLDDPDCIRHRPITLAGPPSLAEILAGLPGKDDSATPADS